MSKLPAVNGRQVISALQRAGFEEVRRESSHHQLRKDGHPFVVTVPVHGSRTIPIGTLRSIIRAAGLTPTEFTELLNQ